MTAEKYDAAGIPLTAVERFPEARRTQVREVIEAIAREGLKAEEYLVHITEKSDEFYFHLRHKNHPTDWQERGDVCGKCRAIYLSKDQQSLKIYGIR